MVIQAEIIWRLYPNNGTALSDARSVNSLGHFPWYSGICIRNEKLILYSQHCAHTKNSSQGFWSTHISEIENYWIIKHIQKTTATYQLNLNQSAAVFCMQSVEIHFQLGATQCYPADKIIFDNSEVCDECAVLAFFAVGERIGQAFF